MSLIEYNHAYVTTAYLQLSIQSFVIDVFSNLTKDIDRKLIIMHATYTIASAGESDELYEVARKVFVQVSATTEVCIQIP